MKKVLIWLVVVGIGVTAVALARSTKRLNQAVTKATAQQAEESVLSPAQTVSRFYKLSADGEIKRARELRQLEFGDNPRIRVDPSLFPPWEELFRDGELRFDAILSENSNGDKADVVATIVYEHGKRGNVIHHLTVRKGFWKIVDWIDLDSTQCRVSPDSCRSVREKSAETAKAGTKSDP